MLLLYKLPLLRLKRSSTQKFYTLLLLLQLPMSALLIALISAIECAHSLYVISRS
jgi:hypothetical protein